jgi:hypothetical protein
VNTPNQDAAFAAMQKAFKDASDPTVALDPLRVLLGIVTAFGPLRVVDDKQRADEQVTLAAAAILDTKARTGAFPTNLPGNFTDPFNGKPLGYRLIGDNGFVVYSVGPDGTFDGNANTQSQYPTRQVFFQYPAPAPQPVPADMLKIRHGNRNWSHWGDCGSRNDGVCGAVFGSATPDRATAV